MPGVRVREPIEPHGFDGGKSIVDEHLREVRPFFGKTRTHYPRGLSGQRDLPVDLWEPSAPVPVVGCLGYSRAGAGALIISKDAPDVLWEMGRWLRSLGALPALMMWDREG